MTGYRRHGIWIVLVGVLVAVGAHGGVWGLYHLVRALLIFGGH